MQEHKEEKKIVKTFCDLVYQNITSQSCCSTIHRSQAKGKLSNVSTTSKLYRKNRRNINFKARNDQQYPIVCCKYIGKEAQKQNQCTFDFRQAENNPKITKITLSQLKGLSTNTTKASNTKIIVNSRKGEKMVDLQPRENAKKENKIGYQKQKQRKKASNQILSLFFSKYDRVNNIIKMQRRTDSLRSQIIEKYSGKFKLLENL